MQRRQFVIQQSAALVGIATLGHTLSAQSKSDQVQNLSDALRWLDAMQLSSTAQTTSGWPLGAVLEHLAQSIEMSLHGFPLHKSDLFQNTAGAAAFQFFKWRGKMSHSLVEPIPGAPALNAQTSLAAGILRLRTAIGAFNSHTGALKPHFAYGKLSRSDYALAHSMHIANHQDAVVLSKRA